METIHYKKDGIGMFDATTEKVFAYMKVGNHPHRALKSHKLVGVSGNVVTLIMEVYNRDGTTWTTDMTHVLSYPTKIETSLKGGPFDGAKFTHSYTPVGSKTKVDLWGDFPKFPGMGEEDELRDIDAFFSGAYAEDQVTIPKWQPD